MKFKICMMLLFVLCLAFAQDELKVNINKVSDKVAVFTIDNLSVNVTAINSSEGIILIDSGISPTVAKYIRKAIIKHFNSNKFLYVINTHFHFDHSNGNQVFEDAKIVGHINNKKQMHEFEEGIEEFCLNRSKRVERLITSLGKATDENEILELKSMIKSDETMINDLKTIYKATVPEIEVEDRKTLKAGDISLEVIYYGKAHTNSDLHVYIPEEQLLFIGDTFSPTFIAFSLTPDIDIKRWMMLFDEYSNKQPGILKVVNGHSQPLNFSSYQEYMVYIKRLYTKIQSSLESGKSKEEIVSSLSSKNAFTDISFLKNASDFMNQMHIGNIQLIIERIKKFSSGHS